VKEYRNLDSLFIRIDCPISVLQGVFLDMSLMRYQLREIFDAGM